MKRKLLFITLLMLFCSTMLGQHWTMTDAQIAFYQHKMPYYAFATIDGDDVDSDDIEIAAFHGNELRGCATPIYNTNVNKYLFVIDIYGTSPGDKIYFKLFKPGVGEFGADVTVNFDANYVVSEIPTIDFYSRHWNYTYSGEEYMQYPCVVKIDGVIQERTDLELAAFCGDELRGVTRPQVENVTEDIVIYMASLMIEGRNGETINFKLYDPIADAELETDHTIQYDLEYGNQNVVEIEFQNNPVAMITNATGNHYFSSLEAAVAAAQDGETILLLQDVTLEGTLTIEKSITIDGNGFKILPADDSKTYNSAIMVGNSGWGDDHDEVIITLNNIKFNNWKSNYGVVRAQGVTLNMEGCVFNGNDVSNAAYGVLSLNFADATVKNTIFNKNQDRAIDINYNGDDSNAVVTIDGCTFEENASDGAGIVVRNDGTQLVVTNSKFLNNTVTTSGNAAVLYAGWGEQDEVSGCTFSGNTVTTSHATTIRFASAIFCDGCTVTGNAFENNTATRNGEPITTTVAVGAFYGAANISENYWGGNAPVPGVDYTVEYTYNNVAVNNYYKEYSEGTLSDKVTLNNVAKAGKYYYESITAAFSAVQDGETVTMLDNVSLSETIKVNNKITLDLNGKTITGTDNAATASFALFEVQPSKELTVKDENNTGKITLTATNNRGWNAYSSVISNQRGKLTVNGGTIEHLGGTDMAYGIDNLTNGKGTYAETIINGGTVKSLYRAIRQFLNGIEAQNILTVNGGTIEGANKSIWMQSANANANPGKLTIAEDVTVKGNILLEAEPNATSWPVEVSIVASTLKDGAQVMTENLPSGYELVLENGVYGVYHGVAKIGNNYYDDLSSALNAITSGCTLEILTDITIASDWDCRNTGAKIGVPVTINGNGKTIKFTGKIYDANWNTLFRFEDVATVKNLTLDASAATDIQRGITFKTSVTVDNCTLIGNGTTARYAVIVGEGATAIGDVTANITNSTFKDWIKGVTDNMNGQDMKEFAVTGCTFNNTDVIISAKDKVTFTGNNMSSDSYVNITSYTVPNNVQVVANNNTNLAANTETECNQIAAPLANINAQDGFLTPVAEAGGKYYVTLQGAVNGVADSGTITLLSDIELAAQDAQELFKPTYNRESYCGVYIPDDKTVVLELNGKTVSYLDTKGDFDNVMVMNLGNLTINDNSAEKTGKITYKPVAGTSTYSKFYSTIFNCGTLTVNAGTIENTAEAETDVTNAVDNHSRLSHEYDNNSILIVNGGTLSGAYYYAIRQYTHYFEGVQNRVVINDGNINGGIYMQHGDNWYYANAESNRLNVDCYLEIKGGNINVNTTSDAFGKIKSRLNNPDNNAFGLNISGGTINVPVELLVQRGVYYENGVSGATVSAETEGTRNAEWLAKNDGFVQGGTFSQIGGEEEHTTNLELFLKKGFKLEQNTDGTYGVVVDPDYGMVAKIGETRYETLSKAFADVQEGQTIELLPVTISESTVKLPATLKNVTVKGAEGAVLKDMTIMAADGNSINYEGITFDGVVFENSCISVTGWRNNGAVVKNFTVTNCVFENLDNTTNVAPVHFNMAATEPVNGFTFTNNVIDGATGGSKSGVYAQVTGETVFTNNVINNVSFRPYVIQLTTDDGIADKFTVTGNTFSGSAAGRAQALTNNAEGTDEVELTVSENIFKGITAAQQICYWDFNEATTTATLEKNYYDIDVLANPNRIYYNSPAKNISDLSEMGIFPIYTELNADGTINEESLFDPVAYVGTKAFETLDDAVDEVTENNNTIVVIANVENVNHLIIPAGKNVVLDLNGKTISGECNTSSEHNADLIEVENTATLTIKDSSENEEGKVTYASGTYKTGFTVDVKGNLILESGTIELTGSWSLGFAVDVRPNAWGTAYTEASTFVMNGGKVVSSDTGVRIDSNSGETNPSSRHGVYFTMNGGDIISDWDAIFIQHRYANDLYVNIAENAGTIQGKNSPLRIYGDGVVSDVEINIAGGTFDYTGDEGTTGWVVEKFLKATEAQVEAAKIEITGGTFDADVSRFCAFNYVCTSNGDGTYGIEYKQQENNAFVISTLHELEAFRDAVNAGNNFADQTVVLSAGVDLNPTRAINIWEPIGTQANPFRGTFDGGDHTISNLVVEGENNVGLFGYADNATIKNVKLENVNVKGTDCVGAIAGQVYSTSLIDNCHVSGLIQVEGQTNVGGIVGKYYTKVKNCSVIGDGVATSYVKGVHYAADYEGDNIGGIMGHGGENNTFTNNTVKNITISGTRKVGGIVGVTDQNTDVTNCLVENVNIETTAKAEYAQANAAKAGHASIVGSYTKLGANNNGTVTNCVVKNVTFVNNDNVTMSAGPITGGAREGMVDPTGVTASGNLVYMSTITGTTTNMYLMDPVAKIGETAYYTLFDAVAAVQDGETTITMLRNTAEEFAIDNTTANITLNMAGFTLTGAITPSKANLTIENGTINNENASYSAIEINEGSLNLSNVNIESKRHGVRIDGAVEATIDGGTYKPTATSGTRHAVNVSGAANVTIIDGTFVGPKGTTMDSGSAVNVQSGATVTIEGGDFSGGKNHTLSAAGTLIVKGGTFDQVVKGSYLAEGYVCQMNAENKYEVFFAVAQIGEVNYPSLQKAFNDVDANETITIISNVEESEVILPATLENVIVTASENVVVKNTVIKTPEMGTTSGFAIAYEGLTFNNVNFDNSRVHLTGWANDALSQSVSIKNLVVTNCEFNNIANEENQNYAALHLNVADGVLENLTFTNNKVNGITGGESAALYGNFTGNVTITGNVIRNTSGSSMVVGYSNATIIITDNILENWASSGKGRAIRLDVNNEANASTVVVRGNAMIHANAPEEFVKSTGSNTTVTLNENYWYGNSPREEGMVTAAGVVIDNYYETCTVTDDDFVLGNLVVYAKGTITHGYVNTDRIWGEGSSNSQESFVVKVYAGETLLGQASLNDKDNIIDGDIPNVTWGIPYNTANTDEYWTVEWFEALSPSVVPTTVKLYVDGEFVAENTIKMSEPDDLNPIEWEDIFVAKIEEANTYFTSLQAAINAAEAGQTVVVLDNITLTETVTVAAGTTVTLDLNGKTISAEATFAAKAIRNDGTLTINGNGGTIDISASTTESIQVVDNYGTLTINGGTYKGASSNFSYAIRANHENSVTNIVGATITTYFGAVGINKGETTITDGKFEVTGAAGGHALYVEGANVTINGGEFIPYPTTVYSYAVLTNDDNANVSITGGTFKKGLGDQCVIALSGNIIITGGTFSTDVDDEYCHEYYDAIQGDDNLWRVEQVLFAQTTELQAGWNWFSSYVDLSQEGGLLKLQTALDKSGLAIKGQTGNQSVQYGKIGVVNGEEIYAWTGNQNWNPYSNKMYMVRTSEPITVEIEGDLIDYENTTIALFQGWNWISYPLSEPAYANEALAGLTPTEGDQIKAYGANTYIEYSEGEWFPYDFVFMPGEGYMYKAGSSNSFVYAKGTTNVIRATNKTTENNNWIAQTSEYANNMTITAMLSIDGEVVNDNYEIAAFANGECRGSARPIYIEKFDAYILFMTVYGEEVEDLTFRYYDVNYGTEYELDNRVVYSNDASLGSINDPYMFTLNITGVDETSMSEINIYPNPTTIGSEINLQATCDKVEVFNALGVKIAEYHNVDTFDAFETAGIYVIRITNDNAVKHCRLVVK